MERNKDEINFLNTLFCLMVMLIHVLSKSVSTLDKTSLQYISVFVPWRLSAFVVQGFIFLSGIKFMLKYDKTDFRYLKFLKSRFLTIVIPYVLWVVISYFVLMAYGYFDFNFIELLRYIFQGNLISHFYFVIIIVQFYALAPLWKYLFNRFGTSTVLVLSMLIMVIAGQSLPSILSSFGIDFQFNDRVFSSYIFYWAGGCLVGKNYVAFVSGLKKNMLPICLGFFAIAICNLYFSYTVFAGKALMIGLENIHIMYCVFAILFSYIISLQVGEGFMRNKILKKINAESYNIYLSHCLLIYVCEYFLSRMGINDGTAVLMLRFIFVFGGALTFWTVYNSGKKFFLKRKKVV